MTENRIKIESNLRSLSCAAVIIDMFLQLHHGQSALPNWPSGRHHKKEKVTSRISKDEQNPPTVGRGRAFGRDTPSSPGEFGTSPMFQMTEGKGPGVGRSSLFGEKSSFISGSHLPAQISRLGGVGIFGRDAAISGAANCWDPVSNEHQIFWWGGLPQEKGFVVFRGAEKRIKIESKIFEVQPVAQWKQAQIASVQECCPGAAVVPKRGHHSSGEVVSHIWKSFASPDKPLGGVGIFGRDAAPSSAANCGDPVSNEHQISWLWCAPRRGFCCVPVRSIGLTVLFIKMAEGRI
ncbi:hypothetical protein CEXT_490071 [Caerostris extrusa]|uniref:Uncharacterized protein n=1 Tax=Caerostris extrusa TaxID=172846 RepID=A0AAV4QY97_CAEEX|nr:hypothetical protein CEXT_490071 [Caerostris extrusa]